AAGEPLDPEHDRHRRHVDVGADPLPLGEDVVDLDGFHDAENTDAKYLDVMYLDVKIHRRSLPIMTSDAFHLCATCGSQLPRGGATAASCPICDDERQYVPAAGGQRFVPLDELRAAL